MKKHFLNPLFLLLLVTTVANAQLRTGLGSRVNSPESAPQKPTSAFDLANPKEYEIVEIVTGGTKFYDANSLVSISGLRAGDKIQIPGDAISGAVRRLMDQGILDDVQIKASKIEEGKIWLNIFLKERPRLYTITFSGIRKGEQETLNDKVKLIKGKIINQSLMKNTQTLIKKHFVDKGFLNTKVRIVQVADTSRGNNAALKVTVDKGSKVKINRIEFRGRTGNEIAEKKLRRKLKGTKQRSFGRIFTPSKFVPKKFEEDKQKLLDYYGKEGYRDARIVSDSVYAQDGKSVNVILNLEEGRRYYYRNIAWSGNYLHKDSVLNEILAIKKGDVYNPEEMQKKLFGNPQYDVSSLYMDDGYLYFSARDEEVAVEGDSIDVVINITEGKQFTINKIILNGNTKTSDHVVMREIRTLPGQKFSKSAVIRTQRELSTLGYFNPEKIGINPIPRNDYTTDIEYTVEEKPSDQIELSGGWGGFVGFVGTLGVVFNNFSARNIANPRAWRPLPAGDGQKLAVRFQANGRYFQNYSLSFTEPWLGGRKPNSFSISINRQIYRIPATGFGANPYGGGGGIYGGGGFGGGGFGGGGFGGGNFGAPSGESAHFNTTGFTISLGKRLRRPDDSFLLNMALSLQRYDFSNYNILRVPGYETGIANNLSLITTFSRSSIDNFQFPRSGSTFSLTGTLTPPYSMLKRKGWLPGTPQEKYKFLEFHKWMFDASWYVPLAPKLVIAARAHMGFVGNYNRSLGIVPFERFSLGGSGLSGQGQFSIAQDLIGLRGYEDRGVGPAQPGGVVYNKFVTEVRYLVSPNPSATIFVLGFLEGGNNWDTYQQFNPFNIKRSAGVGARIFMPAFGLIGIDYGFGFDKNLNRQTGAVQQPGKGQFHFTIGQQIR